MAISKYKFRLKFTSVTLLFLWISSTAAQAQSNVGAPVLPDKPFVYTVEHLDEYSSVFAPNHVFDQLVTLGRVLFYDQGLSANNLVSCASCHKQENGFDDPSRFSIGFKGEITRRSAMGLANAGLSRNGRFFWDERASSLAQQVLEPIFDPIEMGLVEGQLVQTVNSKPYYAKLFEGAFGSPAVSENKIATALAGFVSSLVSFNSPYDSARKSVSSAREEFPAFSRQENRGKTLFFNTCISCHTGDAFNFAPRGGNNGLDINTSRDQGIGNITGSAADLGRFRAPSLRNIAVRAPYMHDGRFASLEEVIDHYSSQIQNHPNLGASLKDETGRPRRFNFNAADKMALIAFLRTLSDQQFLSDPKFSNPFR